LTVEHRRTSDTPADDARIDLKTVRADRSTNGTVIKEVRADDLEPYTGLRYLSKLFRFMAIILLVLLVAEVVTGIGREGRAAIPTLLGEVSKLIVLAGVLWGTGDLALLLVDVGHDVRAARILLARQTHNSPKEHVPLKEHGTREAGATGAANPIQ
jgi:hypothetical protein